MIDRWDRGGSPDQQLMFEQKRLGDNGTSAATSKESGDRGDEMDEKDGQVAASHRTDQHKRDKTWNPLGSMR